MYFPHDKLAMLLVGAQISLKSHWLTEIVLEADAKDHPEHRIALTSLRNVTDQ